MRMLNHGKQKGSQLYHCRSLLTSQDLCLMHKSWIHPTLEYGNILYFGAALSHLQHLDNLQVQIERTCCLTCQLLLHCRNVAIIEFVCCLLAAPCREGMGTCKVSARYSVELITSVAGPAVFMPGILQIICILLTLVIFGHSNISNAFGRFQLFVSGALSLPTCF